MKELSIEQKAIAYDKALERVKELLSRCRNNRDRITMVYRVEDIESIFPELKKNEVEKIKEDLIEWFDDFPDVIWRGHYKKDVIAWLEKQGDTNETINKDEFAQGVLKGAAINLITWIDYNAAEGNMCLSNMECKDVEDALVSGDWNKIYAYIKKKLENNEKKPQGKSALKTINEEVVDNAYKVETNQKSDIEKGKWYVCNTPRYTDFVVGKAYYCPKNGMLKPNEGAIARYVAKDCFHIWTIADAKEGDVLVSRSPFIYGKQCPYGGLNWCNNKFIKASNFIFTDSPVHPATKEQRDLLFQKMKEAEYIFDFKNKELKKIKNDIEIPFGAKDSELQEATYYIPKGFHAEINDDKVVIKKWENPTAWSEEDDAYKLFIISAVEDYYDEKNPLRKDLVNWLKSIKQRIGG